MSIQPPPSSHPPEISVTEPVSAAYERMKLVLFQPFDLGKWFVIGFCAWLAGLGERGGYGGNYNGYQHNHAEPLDQLRHMYGETRDYVLANLAWLVPVIAVAVFILLGLGILFIWLSSRGKFMFLHCAALNKAEVEIPWAKYSAVANSLFIFRLGLWLAGMALVLPLLVTAGVLLVKLLPLDEFDFVRVMPVVGLGMGVFVVALVFALIHKLLVDFVVPILYLRGGTCLAAWREFFRLFSNHPGDLILYILFQIVLAIAIGICLVFVVLLTCCVAGCLMALPYIGTVLLLPVLVFKRAYSLYYLAQFGPQYDVFPPAPPVAHTLPPGLRPM